MDDKIIERIKYFYDLKDNELIEIHNRSLPFQDSIMDRWERAKKLNFGDAASIYNSAFVFGEVKVGANTWIGPNVMLDGSGGMLSIGTHCSISTNVQIYTHDTVLKSLSGGRLPPRRGPVKIGDYCYIGSSSVISLGVNIGNQCVIAANSFVNRSVPDRWIVGGSPAVKIGTVKIKNDEILLDYNDR
ncbi:MAG: acyltransferase [Kordiimonadaceae bacterium]|nr:acyltransferase [Kordiimonadaceae bacterium]